MTCTVHVAWDDALTGYDFGPDHPMAPVRVELTMQLAGQLGVLGAPGVMLSKPEPATDAELELVHDPEYIAAVRRAGGGPDGAGGPDAAGAQDGTPAGQNGTGGRGRGGAGGRRGRGAAAAAVDELDFGLGTADDPVFPRMHEASALVAGATLSAARAVLSGSAQHGASISGGLHHAMADHASGFCIYNDPAIAIAWLLDQGVERIAYVDVDVHHGDGVQAAFYHDSRVLTISLHEHPATLFPGTGRPHEAGTKQAEGYAANVALPAGTNDARWLRAFHAVVPPLLRSFRPQILVSQHGCDTHRLDPLANLELTVDGQRAAHAAIHALAHELTGGRWLLTGGGGYETVQVVPRTWTHLLAEASGQPVDPQQPTPAPWQEYVRERTGKVAPRDMTDGADAAYVPFEKGYDPADAVDQAILATQKAVFPMHGMMPPQ